MKRALCAAALLACSLCLGGCWDNRPIEHRALVLMLGIDQGPDQEFTVYFQMPTSQALSSLSVSSTPSGSGTPPTYIVNGTGKTFSAAMTQAQGKVSGDLYLGQVQAILLSSRLPAPLFENALDFITRIGPMDKTAFVAVTPEPVSALMQHQPQEGLLPSLYVNTLFSCHRCQEIDLSRTVWSMEKRASAPGAAIWLPVLHDQGANYRVERMAIYRGGRPVLTLTPQETTDFGYLINATAKAGMTFSLHGWPVGIRALNSSTRTRVVQQGRVLQLQADLQVNGIVDNLPPGGATLSNLQILENEVSRGIAGQELALLRVMQQKGVDPVGFLAPYLWHHPELTPRAEELYRSAGVKVTVHARIVDVGDVL